MQELINFKNVKKTYVVGDTKFNALDDVDLSINKGEFVVILGPSGAGKSTLLNLLGGMDKVTSGKITVAGKEISKYNDKELTKKRASEVGLENVELVDDIAKTNKKPLEVLKGVGLERHKNKFPSELSGGEQQRVSIARAIYKDPSIILADEPTGALDSKTGVEVLKLLKKQCDANNGENTVVIVTHNSLIAEIADRVIRLKNGKVESNEINKKPKSIDEVVW